MSDHDAVSALKAPLERGEDALVRTTAVAGVAASAAGLVAAVPTLPVTIRAVLLLIFVLVGPGSAILVWTDLDRPLRLTLTPALGLAVVIGTTTAAAFAQWWSPLGLLGLVAGASLVSCGMWIVRHNRGVR